MPTTEHLVNEVHPTNVKAEGQEADLRTPGIDESADELRNNTQGVVPSSDRKLASETTNFDKSSKDIAPMHTEDEENTFALQSETTEPSSGFSGEQAYQCDKTQVDLMLDPAGKIQIAEGSAETGLPNTDYIATTTSDSHSETEDQTRSFTCEVESDSLEKKDVYEEKKIDIKLKDTCDDVHNVVGGPCAEEIHIKNTEEIILDGETELEAVKEVAGCVHGDQASVRKYHSYFFNIFFVANVVFMNIFCSTFRVSFLCIELYKK